MPLTSEYVMWALFLQVMLDMRITKYFRFVLNFIHVALNCSYIIFCVTDFSVFYSNCTRKCGILPAYNARSAGCELCSKFYRQNLSEAFDLSLDLRGGRARFARDLRGLEFIPNSRLTFRTRICRHHDEQRVVFLSG